MKYDYLIFDISTLYHSAYAASTLREVVINKERIPASAVELSVKMIRKRIEEYLAKDGHCYFLFDNPTTSNKRAEAIDPNYKSNRVELPKSFYRGMDYLEYILRSYRDESYVIRETGTEADDWVKPILNELLNSKSKLLISTDMDWARSLNENTHWLSREVLIDIELFEQKYKFFPTESNICFYKTFYGDPSDHVSGALAQFYFELFLKVIEDYTDIHLFISEAILNKIEYLNDSWIKRIDRDKKKIINNWKLVSFQPIDSIKLERYTTYTSFNKVNLKMIYDSLKVSSNTDSRVLKPIELADSLLEPDRLPRK